jgi:hypothetical protein
VIYAVISNIHRPPMGRTNKELNKGRGTFSHPRAGWSSFISYDRNLYSITVRRHSHGGREKNRISMSEVGCRSCLCTCGILHTYCLESGQVLFDIHQAIRYPRQHVSLARIKALHTTFHSTLHGQPITTTNETSPLTKVYYVISTTITKHPNRQIIRCITLWTMGSGGSSLLGEMKPTQYAN